VASDVDTAISEIRPHKGEKVTVAEFKMFRDLELADLRDPKESISPFQLNDDNELELIYKNLSYLTMLGNELSKPIIPQEVNLEYLPSQYLCELIKQIGFHGIIYKSSVSNGNNFVIFNDEKLDVINCSYYEITDTKIYSNKLDL
ncbi:MAG: RES family NAD+ phosphorylase, partial [Candidatus Cloacimonetes bacterium]|nr:RES family NAD+ phosphorylase [Candidatus Cloacimonadota bacterium]